jgi:hypothetical protein
VRDSKEIRLTKLARTVLLLLLISSVGGGRNCLKIRLNVRPSALIEGNNFFFNDSDNPSTEVYFGWTGCVRTLARFLLIWLVVRTSVPK